MDLERVLVEACDALATRRFTRGAKKAKLGKGRKQALLRAVLQAYGRWLSANPPIQSNAPRLRLTARALYECRSELDCPTLAPAAASDALYEWALLLRQPHTVDVEDGEGIARATLRILHERDSESFDLMIDVRRDATGAHRYEPVVVPGVDVRDVRTLFPESAIAAASSPPWPSKPTPDRERRIAKLLLLAPAEARPQLREKLSSAGNADFDRFERDITHVHRLRPKWALWILLGIIGTPLGAYFAYRYYASISVPSPPRFLLSENIRVLPDGTFELTNAGIKTSAIENRATGERITIKPIDNTGGIRVSHTNAQHSLDGIDERVVHEKLGRWTDGYNPGIVILPFGEILDLLQIRPPQPISPTFFIAYVLPAQDPTLAREIKDNRARCTILFSKSSAAEPTKAPASFDSGNDADRIFGWVAVHEYPRAEGRYDIKARVTRANGRVEWYSRSIIVDARGVPIPMGSETGRLSLFFSQPPATMPEYAGYTGMDCCYAQEPVTLDIGAFIQTAQRLSHGSDLKTARVRLVWDSVGWPIDIPARRRANGGIEFIPPPHTYDSPGLKNIHISAEVGPGLTFSTVLPLKIEPVRLH